MIIYISSLHFQNCGHANKGMWEIARKHESYEATEIVLNEVLATLRLDFTDRYAVKEMAVFMFLYLGNNSYIFYCQVSYFLQLSQNLTSDCLLISVFLPVFE